MQLRIPDGFLHRKRPTQLVRLDHDIKNVGVLLDVADAAACAGLLDHLLQQAAADGAVGIEAKRAGRERGISLEGGPFGPPEGVWFPSGRAARRFRW